MTTEPNLVGGEPISLISEQERRGEPLPPVVEILRGLPVTPLPPFPAARPRKPKPSVEAPPQPPAGEGTPDGP